MREVVKRADRVAERVRAELMDMLLRGVVRDPRAKDVVISAVRVTDDLGIARVYIRLLDSADEKRREAAVEAMSSAAGYIRRQLGPRLATKKTPALEFFWDDVIDAGLRIEEVLHELNADGEGGEAP